jgi:HlyD family secretion protein
MKRRAVLIAFAAGLVAAACSRRPAVKTVDAARTRVESTVTTTSSGTVEAEQQAVLGFTAAGRVSRVFVRAGDRVRRGQRLAQLDNADLETIRDDAERELKRAQELFDSGLVSRVALDDARKAFEVARASFDRTVIGAPFDGVVTEVNLEAGGLAQPAAATAAAPAPIRIVDLKPRLVRGDIDEVDLAKVRLGSPARIRVQAVRPEPFEAVVSRVVPFVSSVREQDRTSEVEFRVTPEKEPVLLPVGASADIEIVIASKEDALAVPSRAVLGRSGNRSVLRVRDGRVARAPVKTGIGNYDRTEILSGLEEGDTVAFPPEDVDLEDGARIRAEPLKWP